MQEMMRRRAQADEDRPSDDESPLVLPIPPSPAPSRSSSVRPGSLGPPSNKPAALAHTLFLLMMLNNTVHVIAGNYVRVQFPEIPPTALVLLAEGTKLAISAVLYGQSASSPAPLLSIMASSHCLLLPASLYFLASLLTNHAFAMVLPSVFAIFAQLKLVFVAALSHVLLQHKISSKQWAALLGILVGCSIAKLRPQHLASSSVSGIAVVLVYDAVSAYAGVALQQALQSRKVSIWELNIQLASVSVVFAVLLLLLNGNADSLLSLPTYMLHPLVTFYVLICACEGLLIALVVTYGSILLKTIANCCSVVSTTIATAVFMGASISLLECLGSGVVATSVLAYNLVNTPTPTRSWLVPGILLTGLSTLSLRFFNLSGLATLTLLQHSAPGPQGVLYSLHAASASDLSTQLRLLNSSLASLHAFNPHVNASLVLDFPGAIPSLPLGISSQLETIVLADSTEARVLSPYYETLFLDLQSRVCADLVPLFHMLTEMDVGVLSIPQTGPVQDQATVYSISSTALLYKLVTPVRTLLLGHGDPGAGPELLAQFRDLDFDPTLVNVQPLLDDQDRPTETQVWAQGALVLSAGPNGSCSPNE